MDSLVEKIANKENLMLAWRKIENLFVPGDVWFDPLKLAAFKYRLKDNVDQISDSLLAGTYRLKPIIPVPFPKSRKEGDEEIPIRQSFIIDVADQLVWVAVCNVIGVYLDTKMPAWITVIGYISVGGRTLMTNGKWEITGILYLRYTAIGIKVGLKCGKR